MIVSVKNVPVRYEGRTYKAGEKFEMDKKHLNENLVVVVENDKVENLFSKLTKDELKAELDARGIGYEADAKKDVLIKALEEAPKE
jgi:hypothetical protein